jgi:hypothetical protein
MDSEPVDHDEFTSGRERSDRNPPPQMELAPGCAAEIQPEPATGEPLSADGESKPVSPTAASARRGLKLVVTLRPDGGPAYRALLAVGADGCDPLLRSTEVADLRAALDELPALVAEAEARWQAQPRNPLVQPGSSTRSAATSRPATSDSAGTPRATTMKSARPAGGDAPVTPATGGQLSFFG